MTGLLGGAFDPPHNGHVALAECALQHFSLERLVVMVTGDPPHKRTTTGRWERFALAQAAFAGLRKIELSAHELERPGPSFTVDTVRWAAGLWPDVVFLVGADEFADFLSWKDPDGVIEAARLGVATRPGHATERLEAVRASLDRPDRVEYFEIPAIPISSSQIRSLVARGEPVDELVPGRVAREIERLGLYRPR